MKENIKNNSRFERTLTLTSSTELFNQWIVDTLDNGITDTTGNEVISTMREDDLTLKTAIEKRRILISLILKNITAESGIKKLALKKSPFDKTLIKQSV